MIGSDEGGRDAGAEIVLGIEMAGGCWGVNGHGRTWAGGEQGIDGDYMATRLGVVAGREQRGMESCLVGARRTEIRTEMRWTDNCKKQEENGRTARKTKVEAVDSHLFVNGRSSGQKALEGRLLALDSRNKSCVEWVENGVVAPYICAPGVGSFWAGRLVVLLALEVVGDDGGSRGHHRHTAMMICRDVGRP